MSRIAALLALVLTGCTFGFGSPYVGQYREREAVEFEICVEDASGECAETSAITRHEPARRFWGVSMSYPMLGVAYPTIDGVTQTALRLELNAEYLRGRGRFAWGVRQSAVLDMGTDFFLTAPLMLMGHVGFGERFAAYAGAGPSWYNLYQRDDGNEMTTPFRGYLGGRVLAGLQIVGSRSQRNSRILYSFEADAAAASISDLSYRSVGFTLSIGLFL